MTRLSRGVSLVRIHNGELSIVRSDLKERVRMELGVIDTIRLTS